MDNAHWNYTTKEQFEQYYNRIPKFRYDTMKYCWDQVEKYNFKTVVELGTTRSYVDGKFPGCNEMIQNIGNQITLSFGIGLQDVLLVLLAK